MMHKVSVLFTPRSHTVLRGLFASVWVLAACILVDGCSAPEQGAYASQGPTTTNFENVHAALALRCGSRECHGVLTRNMRIWGYGALRLNAGDLPQADTRPEEVNISYREIVGIEPEVMSAVIREKNNPERLSLVRKAQGLDNHKGGLRMRSGSDFERCLFSWLAGGVDVPACQKASVAVAP
jgi:hypothetical protein